MMLVDGHPPLSVFFLSGDVRTDLSGTAAERVQATHSL
jgi:hypothetical protein